MREGLKHTQPDQTKSKENDGEHIKSAEGIDKGRRRFMLGAIALATVPRYGFGLDEAQARGRKLHKKRKHRSHKKRHHKPEALRNRFKPPEPKEWAGIEPGPKHKRYHRFVDIKDLMEPNLPPPNPRQILGRDTGLIISKRFHRFWLYKDGKLLKIGPIGTGRRDRGKETPEGLFTIFRQEGADYSSKSYPSDDPEHPNMPFASFFEGSGIAFHGSDYFNIRFPVGQKPVTSLLLDNSHGCVNALKSDAKLVHDTLKKGDKVAVLP